MKILLQLFGDDDDRRGVIGFGKIGYSDSLMVSVTDETLDGGSG